jgi:hypothetical protein
LRQQRIDLLEGYEDALAELLGRRIVLGGINAARVHNDGRDEPVQPLAEQRPRGGGFHLVDRVIVSAHRADADARDGEGDQAHCTDDGKNLGFDAHEK